MAEVRWGDLERKGLSDMSLDESHQGPITVRDWLLSRTGAATAIAVSVLAFLTYEGHAAHLLGLLPYLLVFACPLMHMFMHGGHHAQHHHSGRTQNFDKDRS